MLSAVFTKPKSPKKDLEEAYVRIIYIYISLSLSVRVLYN